MPLNERNAFDQLFDQAGLDGMGVAKYTIAARNHLGISDGFDRRAGNEATSFDFVDLTRQI